MSRGGYAQRLVARHRAPLEVRPRVLPRFAPEPAVGSGVPDLRARVGTGRAIGNRPGAVERGASIEDPPVERAADREAPDVARAFEIAHAAPQAEADLAPVRPHDGPAEPKYHGRPAGAGNHDGSANAGRSGDAGDAGDAEDGGLRRKAEHSEDTGRRRVVAQRRTADHADARRNRDAGLGVAAETLPDVHVHIGRVEVRAVIAPTEPVTVAPVRPTRPEAMSLDDYLAKRSRG